MLLYFVLYDEFNLLGTITSLAHSNKDGNILDQFKFTYDPVSNIIEIAMHDIVIGLVINILEFGFYAFYCFC